MTATGLNKWDMGQQFTIENFIENRWAEAKAELAEHAPDYVGAMQAVDGLMQLGFLLPEGLPSPQWRLPVVWQAVLETTHDIVQTKEWLELTLTLLEANLDRRHARYYFEVWTQIAYNLSEKVGKLISDSSKIAALNNKTKKKYRSLLETHVKTKDWTVGVQAIVNGVDDTIQGWAGHYSQSYNQGSVVGRRRTPRPQNH